jgi:hypothetical protein
MPTNTFEHLGTTVVSGSSTTSIVFSGLSSWTNVIFVGRIQPDSGTTQMNVNLGGTQVFQNMYASGSSGTGVPNSTRYTGAGSCDLTFNQVSASVSGVSFKAHLIKQGTSRGYFLCEAGFQKSSSTMEFVVSNCFTPNNVTSVTLGFFGSVIKAGSTISAYGVMI